MLGTVLSSGRSSRLFQQIVREQQLAPNVTAGRDGAIGPGLFRVIGTVAPGKTAEALEAAIYAEIERVKNGPIEDWEIEKARNNAKRARGRRPDQLAAAGDAAGRVRRELRRCRT